MVIFDMEVVKEYNYGFPDKFLGLSPPSQVKFQFDIIHGMAPKGKSTFRLVRLEMK